MSTGFFYFFPFFFTLYRTVQQPLLHQERLRDFFTKSVILIQMLLRVLFPHGSRQTRPLRERGYQSFACPVVTRSHLNSHDLILVDTLDGFVFHPDYIPHLPMTTVFAQNHCRDRASRVVPLSLDLVTDVIRLHLRFSFSFLLTQPDCPACLIIHEPSESLSTNLHVPACDSHTRPLKCRQS